MGLLANIFRDDTGDSSNRGMSHGVNRVVIVNAEGPFNPAVYNAVAVIDHPAGPYFQENYGSIAVPVNPDGSYRTGGMFGGTFIFTHDSRGPNRPVPLHDRFEE